MIGPLFTPYTPPIEILPPGIAPLNVTCEWASPASAVRIPLFRRTPHGTKRRAIEQVVLRSTDLPCDVKCTASSVLDAEGVLYVPFEAVIAELYRSGRPRPLFDLLRDLMAMIPLQTSNTKPAPDGCLVASAEEQGFRLATAIVDGDDTLLEIGWRPSRDTSLLHVLNAVIPAQEPDAGAWIDAPAPGIAALLSVELHRLLPGQPSHLISSSGRQFLKSLRPEP